MRKGLFAAVAVALVVGLSASDALARGGRGGGGGGRGAGGGRSFDGGGRSFDAGRGGDVGRSFDGARAGDAGRANNIGAQGNRGIDKSTVNNFRNQTANGQIGQGRAAEARTNFGQNRPFTNGWYANHPGAWRFGRPGVNAWGIATLAGAGAWIGAAGYGGYGTTDSALTSDDGSDDADDDAADTSASDEMPLGVFSLAASNQTEANALIQLALSRSGELHGTYLDLLTDQEQLIQGNVDKKTQAATFNLGPNGKVAFETTLATLTQPKGPITLRFENGSKRDYTLTRFDEQPAAAK